MLAFIGVVMVFVSILTPITVEAATTNRAENLPQYRAVVEKNLLNFKTTFTVVYTGNQHILNENLKNIVPTEIKKNVLIDATVQNYKYTGKKNSKTMQITYNVTYLSTKEQEQYAQREAKKIAKNIMKKHKGQFNRVKAVNDYLVQNTSYGGSTNAKYTTYGLLKNKIAVCQGYSITGYRILKEMKIPVRYVKGTSKNQYHAWLKVSVSGEWYNLDITWNDPMPNNNYKKVYKYFLLSDAQLRTTHKWNNASYPKATDKKYNFLNSTSSVTRKGTTLYYANDKQRQKLYSFNLKTGKHQKISNTRVQNLTYKKGKIYFSNYTRNGELTRMNTDGKGAKVLNDSYTKNIHVKGSKIIYYTNGKYYQRNA